MVIVSPSDALKDEVKDYTPAIGRFFVFISVTLQAMLGVDKIRHAMSVK